MAKLSDTQSILLTVAAQRANGDLPPPGAAPAIGRPT